MSSDVIKRSVTKNDIPEDSNTFGLYVNLPFSRAMNFNFWLPGNAKQSSASIVPLLPDLPLYWTRDRDFFLSKTPLVEGTWASAVAIAISKMSSLNWTVEGDVALQNKNAQELLHTPNAGAGWTHFLSQHLR